jgi:hypothetical protein
MALDDAPTPDELKELRAFRRAEARGGAPSLPHLEAPGEVSPFPGACASASSRRPSSHHFSRPE